MKQGATGFLKIKIDDVIRIDEVNSIVFTVTTPDRDLQFKKSYPDDVAYEEGYYYIPLFQQDTVNMEGVYKIEAQINMKSAEVVKTTINKLFINSSLNTTMLDSNPSFKQIGSLVDMKVEGIAIGRDGENGATFTPIMTGTVLSWKNDKGYENPQPVDLKGAPYEESQEFKDYYKKVLSVVKQAENVSGEIDTKQETFNNNYESKVQETDKYFEDKKTQASNTLNQYVETEKVNMQKFVAAEQEKYNQNAEDKINKFNNNAENKTNGFNQNAKSKQDSFDENSVNKTNDFNSNASTKTSTFNENYIQKSSDFNSSVETAKNEIAEQKQSSILEIENKTEYGKNVINSNKNSALADINDKRVEAIEEVEAQAKSYQVQIDELKEKDKYSSTFFENMFALQRTGKIYTVKFPKWETSHISTGEKLDANAGLICEPSTKTIKGKNNYANIPLFKTYDVNAYVDDEGVRHVTAIKGDGNFKDEGKVDVFVLGMSYYEKYWEDEQYWYYSRTDMPKEGYTVARECINRDGTIQPFALYAKYVSGDIDGVLYSSKGLMPSRRYDSTTQLGTLNANNSYKGMIFAFQKRGKFYSGGMTCDYKYILTTFYLKYATLNSQRIMTGCTNYSFQYVASIQSEDKSTYFPLTKSQANTVEVGSYVSVGYTHINKSTDRYYQNMHMYANNVKVLRKEAIDDNNVAIYLDVKEPFNTMPITVADGVVSDIYISSMHWYSGFSDDVLDRDGCPCDTNEQLTNGKFPMVIQGIECMVGGYETYGNAFMDIVDATGKREVYIQNDASQLTTDIATAKTTYKKSPYAIQPTKLNSWNYITRIDFDLENGAFVQTNVGQDGSSTTTGFADGVYVDNASSGQREFLGFCYLWSGSIAGLSCCSAYNNVASAYWSFLARLSINGVRG